MKSRVALATMITFLACRSAGRTRVSNGYIEVRRVSVEGATRTTALSARAAMQGDWVLADRDLRITIAGPERRTRNEAPGAVAHIALRSVAGDGALRSIEPVLRIGMREPITGDVHFEALLVGALPTLRVSTRVTHGGATLEVVRDWWLETGRRGLHLRTRVTNVGTRLVADVLWGVRLVWGAAPFAPGVGLLTDAGDVRAPWVGHAVENAAAAWTRLSGARMLALHVEAEAHSGVAAVQHVEARSTSHALAPGASIEDHCLLVLSDEDLGSVARAVAWARGERVGETSLVLTGDAREPTVTVTDAHGAVALIASPRAHTHSLPLPPGTYTAVATAPGHAASDPVRFTVSAESAGAVPVELAVPRGGHLRVDARDEETGRELPVRITVRGIAGTRDPNLGPGYRAAGAGLVAVTLTGHTEIAVPPGRYRVTLSHGPEWTLSEHEVSVTETLRGDVSGTLRHVVPMHAWVGCDLHVHANPSFDSRVTIEDRVASLVAEGVAFATPTEHNVVGDYSVGVALLPDPLRDTLQWVPAVEVTTDRSAQPWGHFNVYPYHPDPTAPSGSPPPFLNTSPRQIFRAARANNPEAIIQVNHPRMQPNIGYFNTTGLDTRTNRAVSPDYDPGFDAVEVFNGFYLNQLPQVEGVLHDWMSLLGTGARYVGTGSSDSHQVLFQWAGYPRTYVRVAPDDALNDGTPHERATILRALRAGRAFVTTGPMLLLSIQGAEPGDTLAVARDEAVRVRVRVLAAPWIPVDTVELYRDGQRVASMAVAPSTAVERFDAETTLPVSPGSFVLAVARGPRGGLNAALPYSDGVPFAFTNPIFFDRGATPPGR